jgi:hypothetical protein
MIDWEKTYDYAMPGEGNQVSIAFDKVFQNAGEKGVPT